VLADLTVPTTLSERVKRSRTPPAGISQESVRQMIAGRSTNP
jgi:hypothetical protein